MPVIRYDFLEFLDGSIQIGETKQLFHIRKVEIPSIQRDYAQGRLGENNELNQTGCRFIDTIFEFLISEQMMFELDFIYGSIEPFKNDGYKFIPLDGQQRLTTLFLLYWFIGKNELDQEKQVTLMEKLSRFSYATRTSARRFCEKITESTLEYHGNEKPSVFLRRQKWFRQAQEDDPTVEAMLHMLDAIFDKYTALNRHDIWQRLPYMKFYVQPLEDFNLTEELYVKMNARGKPLTALENFKAELVRWMTKEGGGPFQQKDNKGYYFWLRIARKMDNDWLNNLFWKLLPISEKQETKKQEVDPAGAADILFYRFICRYVLMEYSIKRSIDTTFTRKPELDKTFDFLAKEEDYKNLNPFNTLLDISEIAHLETIFDKLCSHYQEIIEGLKPSWGASTDNSILFGGKIEQRERLIFYGVTSYLRQDSPFNFEKYRQWMRVVWNIAQNTDVNDYASMNGLLGLLSELSQSAGEIYQKLPTMATQSNAGRLALKEEKEKCALIQKDMAWETKFIDLEKHQFFKGGIGFVLDENIDLNVFSRRATLLEELFDGKGFSEQYRNSKHLLIRAIISRYSTIESLNEKHFVETDENEHYLKKLLAEDSVTRLAIRQLVSQADVEQMKSMLNTWIDEPSQMPDSSPSGRFRFIHERLYKSIPLQEWIQNQNQSDKKHILKLSWYDKRIYICRYRSWYIWMLLDGFRNEIVDALLNKNYILDVNSTQQCSVNNQKIPFFTGARDEPIRMRKDIDGKTIVISIDREKVHLFIVQENNKEKNLGIFEYQNAISDLMQLPEFIAMLERHANEAMVGNTLSDIER